jgi:hypothetical protein
MPSYPIDPLVDGLPLNLRDLMDELSAARQAVHELWVEPKAESAEIEKNAWERAAHYTLLENARHPSIKKAAETVGEATSSFGDVCNAMDTQHAVVTYKVRSRIEIAMMEDANRNLQELGAAMASAAKRADFAAIHTALNEAAVGFDTTSKEFLGGKYLDVLRIGSLIDVGNAFANLAEMRHVAMQRYAKGQEPHGWRNRLPRPVQAVFTEGTCIALEKGVEVFLGQGIPGLIPMGATIVGVGRLAFEIRDERRQTRLAFRRGDVDDMLDLADQLTEATSAAQRHIEIVNTVDLAVKE